MVRAQMAIWKFKIPCAPLAIPVGDATTAPDDFTFEVSPGSKLIFAIISMSALNDEYFERRLYLTEVISSSPLATFEES